MLKIKCYWNLRLGMQNRIQSCATFILISELTKQLDVPQGHASTKLLLAIQCLVNSLIIKPQQEKVVSLEKGAHIKVHINIFI